MIQQREFCEKEENEQKSFFCLLNFLGTGIPEFRFVEYATMATMTEGMVLNKSRADSLENVRNLNLWGNDLQDVSLLQKLSNVEVLSLSVNKIKSLQEFRYCTNYN
jgi:Leucine-rich repeat (LRR) protein